MFLDGQDLLSLCGRVILPLLAEVFLMSHCVVSGKDITVSTYTYLQAVSAVPRKHGYYLWDGGFMRMMGSGTITGGGWF